MNIKLQYLKLENFKGLKHFEAIFDGESAVIKGQNGAGKTSIYDAFLYLLFNKDSQGRTDFDLRPLDRHNQAIKGLTVSVTAAIEVDGVEHIFRKEQTEKIVKEQFKGYESACWINDVPKKISEYQEYIAEIIPEEKFKLLTDLNYFNAKLGWKQRREVLLEIAGEVSIPEGFESLLSELKGRTVDEYKKVLSEQKKRHEKERDDINPRMDEILKNLEHPDTDVTALKTQRTNLEKQIRNCLEKRQEVFGKETARNKLLEKINNLKGHKIKREAELKADTSGVQKLLDEKTALEKMVYAKKELAQSISNKAGTAQSDLSNAKSILQTLLSNLDGSREKLKIAENAMILTICFECGGQIPARRMNEYEKIRSDKIEQLTANCKRQQEFVQLKQHACELLENECSQLKLDEEKAKIAYDESVQRKQECFTEIDEAIKNRPTTPPEQDEAWQQIVSEITKAESQLGEPVSEQLEAIETVREGKQQELNSLNKTLAQADRFVKDGARVKELEAREKELSQFIADVEGKLNQIREFNMAYSHIIEDSVNDKFQHVKFKLFEFRLNGEINDQVCEAMFNGVPYPAMSFGERFISGVDIVNVLSEHYEISVPLFIDNMESYTFPLEANSQTIGLFAVKGVKELIVETMAAKKAVA